MTPGSRAESNWWEDATREALGNISEAVRGGSDASPLLIAGDLGDRWDLPLETVNRFIRFMKDIPGAMIPGQHDMPYHDIDLIRRSAYHTIALALPGMYDLSHRKVVSFQKCAVVGIPWTDKGGMKGMTKEYKELIARALAKTDPSLTTTIALAHTYCHYGDGIKQIPGVDETCHVDDVQDAFRGFDFVIIGDNHRPFAKLGKKDYPTVVNCGGVFNTTTKEKGEPRFAWRLYSDKSVNNVQINDPDNEKWSPEKEEPLPKANLDEELQKFVNSADQGLEWMQDTLQSFRKILKKYPKEVQYHLSKFLDEAKQ